MRVTKSVHGTVLQRKEGSAGDKQQGKQRKEIKNLARASGSGLLRVLVDRARNQRNTQEVTGSAGVLGFPEVVSAREKEEPGPEEFLEGYL